MRQDLIYALRNLRAHPGFAAAAIGTLALAIGLNTSLFTVFNAVALRPWPVPDSASVFTVHRTTGGGFTWEEYAHLSEHARSAALAFHGSLAVRLDDDPPGKPATGALVSGNFFRVLGVGMALGPGFAREDDRLDAPEAVVILSDATWKRRYGSDPRVLGRTIRLDGVPFTIVGIAPRGLSAASAFPQGFYIPAGAWRLLHPGDRAPAWSGHIVARVHPGAGRRQANAELDLLNPRSSAADRILLAGTAPFDSPGGRREFGAVFGLMFAATLLVLLLACANVGNLLLARAAERRREIAVRLSLGAARARVVRQLLTESSALAAAAAALGFALAAWLPGVVLRTLVPEPVDISVRPDLAVAGFATALAAVACVAFGLAPALHGTRLSLAATLKDQAGFLPARVPLRSVLLAAQVAASVILLVSASLLVRGIQQARAHDPGYRTRASAGAIALPAEIYTPARRRALMERLVRELDADPAIGPAAVATHVPLGEGKIGMSFQAGGQTRFAFLVEASPRYFEALGIPIVAGRALEPADTDRNIVVVNETLAKRYWPGQSALGKTIQAGKTGYSIAGVVKDTHSHALDQVHPTVYTGITGHWPAHLVARPNLAPRAAAILARLEPRAAVQFAPLQQNIDAELRPARMGSAVAGALGAAALALAAVGMFGVFAYSVRRRTREIGTRMALGAAPARVIAEILWSSSRAIAAGLGIGLAGAAAASTILDSGLRGAARLDLPTYAGVIAVVAIAALAASLWPARMISRVDPMAALRSE